MLLTKQKKYIWHKSANSILTIFWKLENFTVIYLYFHWSSFFPLNNNLIFWTCFIWKQKVMGNLNVEDTREK